MIEVLLAIATVAFAITAAFARDIRRAALCLWGVGMGVGGLYLAVGAELIAISQWMLSTFSCGALLFYAVVFGDYGKKQLRELGHAAIWLLVSGSVGVAFVAVTLVAFKNRRTDLVAVIETVEQAGVRLVNDHFLAVAVIAATLFMVVVGSGVVARDQRHDQEGG